MNHIRFVPIDLMDVAGLVPGASEGKGLGNQFLDDLRQADCFIQVVDASGGTSIDGKPVKPGTHDPVEDVLNTHPGRKLPKDKQIVGIKVTDKEGINSVLKKKGSFLYYSLGYHYYLTDKVE